MEGFYPDGRVKYKIAVDYERSSKKLEKDTLELVTGYMKNPEYGKLLFRVLDRSGKSIYYDGVFCWQERTFDQLKKGECTLTNEFVSYVLKKLKKKLD